MKRLIYLPISLFLFSCWYEYEERPVYPEPLPAIFNAKINNQQWVATEAAMIIDSAEQFLNIGGKRTDDNSALGVLL